MDWKSSVPAVAAPICLVTDGSQTHTSSAARPSLTLHGSAGGAVEHLGDCRKGIRLITCLDLAPGGNACVQEDDGRALASKVHAGRGAGAGSSQAPCSRCILAACSSRRFAQAKSPSGGQRVFSQTRQVVARANCVHNCYTARFRPVLTLDGQRSSPQTGKHRHYRISTDNAQGGSA